MAFTVLVVLFPLRVVCHLQTMSDSIFPPICHISRIISHSCPTDIHEAEPKPPSRPEISTNDVLTACLSNNSEKIETRHIRSHPRQVVQPPQNHIIHRKRSFEFARDWTANDKMIMVRDSIHI